MCASLKGILGTIPIVDKLTANKYQLEKFIKHTVPSSCADYKTVFTGVGSESYKNAVINAYMSGGVEVDNYKRNNIVWVGSESNGVAYKGGQAVGFTHGVKVVLPHDENKLHAFPIESGNLRTQICSVCGSLVIV